jgi:septal ring factor EnvC (AmiA/AmiB activator)
MAHLAQNRPAALLRRPRQRWLGALLFALGGLGLMQTARVLGQAGASISTDVEIAALLDEIEASTAKQDRFDREVSELSSKRDQVRRDLRGRVRALYRVTRIGLAPLAGGLDSVLRHVAGVKRLRRVVEKQALQLGSLDSQAKSLRAEAGKLSQTLERARVRLTTLQSSPRSSRDAIGALGDDASSDRPLGEGSSVYGLRLVDPAPIASFDAERGNLASPVTGDVRMVAGRRKESDGPGLEFQAPLGTPVRAVAAGRVAFSDRYGSYGRLVILDHGGGYYTVYGGLGAVEVRVGDDLSSEARIGSIGSDFSPTALFFEVRKGTRTLEPRSWLGL